MKDWIDWIEIVNAQTIPRYRFELPREGIVKFSGDNNDGKSILRKFLFDIIGCQLHIKDNRHTLINDNEDFAMCTIHRNSGVQLQVYAHRESSKTYYQLDNEHGSVKRYLKDKGLNELVYDFGLHYLAKRDFSFNVHPANTPNLFETTTSVCNKEAYDSVTEDMHLNQAIESVTNIIVEIKDEMDKADTQLAIAQSKINTYVLIDEYSEINRVRQLQKLLKAIECIRVIDLVDLKDVPDISYLRKLDSTNLRYYLDNMTFPIEGVEKLIKNAKILSGLPTISDASESMGEFLKNKEAYENETCPVCGRRVFDNDSCKIQH